jgi:hypothetical protein
MTLQSVRTDPRDYVFKLRIARSEFYRDPERNPQQLNRMLDLYLALNTPIEVLSAFIFRFTDPFVHELSDAERTDIREASGAQLHGSVGQRGFDLFTSVVFEGRSYSEVAARAGANRGDVRKAVLAAVAKYVQAAGREALKVRNLHGRGAPCALPQIDLPNVPNWARFKQIRNAFLADPLMVSLSDLVAARDIYIGAHRAHYVLQKFVLRYTHPALFDLAGDERREICQRATQALIEGMGGQHAFDWTRAIVVEGKSYEFVARRTLAVHGMKAKPPKIWRTVRRSIIQYMAETARLACAKLRINRGTS